MDDKMMGFDMIPVEVKLDNRLSDGAKLLYGTILSLSRRRGYCYARNKYLAKNIGKSIPSVARLLPMLIKNGYLTIENKSDSHGNRKIKLTRNFIKEIIDHKAKEGNKEPDYQTQDIANMFNDYEKKGNKNGE